MIEKIRKLIKPKYETLNKISIESSSIIYNYQILKSCQKDSYIFPVLKSNAYGHGLREVCKILNATDAPMIAIDSFPEAQIAYRYFKKRVLILGSMPPSAYSYCRLSRTDFCVYEKEALLALSKLGRARVHLFLNSGMNREGIQDMERFLSENKGLLKKLEVVGLCSHLASADERSLLNQKQLDRFFGALQALNESGYHPEYIHLGNSAAIFTLHDKRLTAFRSGLALYGYNPLSPDNPVNEEALKLKPALSLTSKIVSIQEVAAGESVSYNETYKVSNRTRVAAVPFGYYEGLSRSLSNNAAFICRKDNEEYLLPVAGKVCMNLCCVDIKDYNISIGDQVEIFSSNPHNANSIINLSKAANQIPYEFLVKIQGNIRREII